MCVFDRCLRLLAIAASLVLAVAAGPVAAQYQQSPSYDQDDGDRRSSRDSDSGSQSPPTTLLGPTVVQDSQGGTTVVLDRDREEGEQDEALLDQSRRLAEPPEPNEFEIYVERMTGKELPRFGADLLLPSARDFAVPATATIPPDYRINVGDVISISLAGTIEGSVEREVDTSGNIFLPSVGQVHVAGVRQGDLLEFLASAIGTQFRNFRVGVRVPELRGIRAYVTGFANNPGAFSLNSLSTLSNLVLQAEDPPHICGV